MRIFRSYTYTWWQMAIVKLALLALGMILGAYLSGVVLGNLWLLVTVWLLAAGYILWLSFKPASPTKD